MEQIPRGLGVALLLALAKGYTSRIGKMAETKRPIPPGEPLKPGVSRRLPCPAAR